MGGNDTCEKIRAQFEELFPDLEISNDKSWSELTTLGVGSSKPLVISPPDDIVLAAVLKFCKEQSITFFVIGGGSNIVGTDDDVPVAVISLDHNNFSRIKPGRKHLTVGAGVKILPMLKIAAENSLGGMSGLSGIPGTVGGLVRMNAGANGVAASDFISDVCGFRRDGTPWASAGRDIVWRYRGSNIPDDVVITTVIFRMASCEPEEEMQLINAHLSERAIDFGGKNAGCVFRNTCEHLPAGRLLEHAGCKGWTEGGIMISEVHANYFVNTGEGSEYSFIKLITRVRRLIYGEFGLYLVPEVVFANHSKKFEILEDPAPPLVAVLKGGSGNEREVSLESGAAVATALRKAGYRVIESDISEPKINDQMYLADIVFPVLHGGFGEDGRLQAMMEQEDISFIGSGSVASALIMDKIESKKLMRLHNIPTPAWTIVTPDKRSFPEDFNLPLIVKPPREGSTVGISLVETVEQWEKAVEEAFKYETSELLVEEYIAGAETTVGVIDGKVLPMVEIQLPGKIYDYDAKYVHANGETRYLCPPETIPEEIQDKAADYASEFYFAAQARDILRVDMIVTPEGEIYVLEGNSIPGFTSSSLVPKGAAAAGICFEELCAYLVNNAILGR